MTLRMNKLYRKIDELEQKNLTLMRGSPISRPRPVDGGDVESSLPPPEERLR